MTKKYSLRVEKRKDIGFAMSTISIVVALLVSFLVTAGVIFLSGADPKVVLFAIAIIRIRVNHDAKLEK